MSGLHKPLGSKVAGWGEAVAEGKQERSAGASLRKDYNKKENLSIFGCRLSFGFAIHTLAFTLLMSLPPTNSHSFPNYTPRLFFATRPSLSFSVDSPIFALLP